MFTVYILRSIRYPERYYTGLTSNLDKRLKEHNNEESRYSKSFAPWEVESCFVFKNKVVAENFERYLKSGSGYAFMKKRLIGAK